MRHRVLLCRGLEVLKVEGNQLVAMPAGVLRLHRLQQLKVINNFMHPVFWKDAMADQPQVTQSVTRPYTAGTRGRGT